MPVSASSLLSRKNCEDPSHRGQAFIDGACVDVAGGATCDRVRPVGGHKRSGFGGDKSLHAMEKYTELKSTWIQFQ